jgi:putative ABC transport system permease protein
MGIPFLLGRDFNDADVQDSHPVAIINHKMAERYFPNVNPIGQHIGFGSVEIDKGGREIVGVVGDIKFDSLELETPLEMYAPYLQDPNTYGRYMVAVCEADNPDSVAPLVRDVFKGADPNQPVFGIRTMEDRLTTSIKPQQFTMILLGIFASIALILSAVGIYGVMAYSVSQRTHEIGIRMALGAQSGKVLRLVIGQGMTLALLGVGIGVIGALGLKDVMTSLLFGVSGTDAETFVVLSLLLSAVALLANYIPARRATRVDPMIALRYE